MIYNHHLFDTVDTCLDYIKAKKHLQKESEISEFTDFTVKRNELATSPLPLEFKLNEYVKLVEKAEDTMALLDKLSRKLVVLSKFLLEVAVNYMTSSGKLVIKWYQYPKVISMLLSFLKEIVTA